MGWNDSRVTLVPPRWQIAIEESDRTAFDGSPVRIEYTERSAHSGEIKINPEEIRAWLEKEGFELQRRSHAALRMRKAEIEVFLDCMKMKCLN